MNIRLCSVSEAAKRAKSFGRRRTPESYAGLSALRRVVYLILSCLLPLATDAIISRLMLPLRSNESDKVRTFRHIFRSFLVAARNLARFFGVVNALAFIRHGHFMTLPARLVGGCACTHSRIHLCCSSRQCVHPSCSIVLSVGLIGSRSFVHTHASWCHPQRVIRVLQPRVRVER